MSPILPNKHRGMRKSLSQENPSTTRPANCESLFSCIERRPNHASPDALPRTYKRNVLAQLDKNASLTDRRQPGKSAIPVTIPIAPTQDILIALEETFDIGNALFDGEVRSRTLQEAGKSMGFDLKLDCYDPAPISIEDWCESQDTLLQERSILKDPQDLVEMGAIAKGFETALGQ